MRFLQRCGILAALCLATAAVPRTTVAQFTVVETLRIGGPDEGPYLFSDIRGLAPGANGSVLVLDWKAQEIRLFDNQGRFVKRVARRGNGPGEIANANGLLVAPNGEIWVNDPDDARWSVFSPTGDFLRQHVLPILSHGYVWEAMIDASGVIHDPLWVPSAGGGHRSLMRRVRSNGHVIDTVSFPRCELRGTGGQSPNFEMRRKTGGGFAAIPFLPSPVSVLDRRGFTWCSSRDRYEILQIRIGRGDTVRRVSRDAPPIAVSRHERDSVVGVVKNLFMKLGAAEPDYSRIPNVKPAIETIDVDDGGRLWVRRSSAESRGTLFELWEEGASAPVTVEAPWRLSAYFHPVIRGDTLLTWALDGDDVPFVVRGVLKRE